MSLTVSGIFKLPDAGTSPLLNWRKLLPPPLKRSYRVLLRNLRDLESGVLFRFAKSGVAAAELPYFIEVTQPILANAWQQNKQQNFQQAAQFINSVCMQPGQVFSFWKTVGNPSEARGFKKGRNIMNGVICETPGGGLCQLSGIIYHTSLMAGLQILERHNHSVDLYANGETRFTPLGADAAVVFGYKDLRVGNPFGFAIGFEIEVVGDMLVCCLRSEKPVDAWEILFKATAGVGATEVLTLMRAADGNFEQIGRSVYEVK